MLVKKSDRAEFLEILQKKTGSLFVCGCRPLKNRRTAQRCLFADNPERQTKRRVFYEENKKHALLLSYKDCSSARFLVFEALRFQVSVPDSIV